MDFDPDRTPPPILEKSQKKVVFLKWGPPKLPSKIMHRILRMYTSTCNIPHIYKQALRQQKEHWLRCNQLDLWTFLFVSPKIQIHKTMYYSIIIVYLSLPDLFGWWHCDQKNSNKCLNWSKFECFPWSIGSGTCRAKYVILTSINLIWYLLFLYCYEIKVLFELGYIF